VVVNKLTNQSNRLLGEILVDLRHVEIINKVDQSLSSGRSVKSTGSLIDTRLNNNLQTHGVGVRVEIDLLCESGIGVNSSEEIFYDRGFTSTSCTNVKNTLLSLNSDVQQELLSSGFSSSYNEGGESSSELGVKWLNDIHPVVPLVLDRVEVVIVNATRFGELKLGLHSSQVAVEISLGFINARSERPDHSKSEEAIVHLLDSIHNITALLGFLA